MSNSDWLWLGAMFILCMLFGGAGYSIGYMHRREDDAELLKRLAKASRNAGYSALALNVNNRAQLLTDANDAERWAECLEELA